MTLNELASRVDSYVGNLSRIERDLSKPSLELLYKIAQALDYRLADIFNLADFSGEDKNSSQSALNTVFISLFEEDQELLVEFAKLLQSRQAKNLNTIQVTLHQQPAGRHSSDSKLGTS